MSNETEETVYCWLELKRKHSGKPITFIAQGDVKMIKKVFQYMIKCQRKHQPIVFSTINDHIRSIPDNEVRSVNMSANFTNLTAINLIPITNVFMKEN